MLDYSRWNRRFFRCCHRTFPLLPCVSTYGLSMPASLCRETRLAGCALIKRPHLSAVSFLKSGADSFAGTHIAVQPVASSEEAELWGPAKRLSSQPAGAKRGAFSRFLLDALRFNGLQLISPLAWRGTEAPRLPSLPLDLTGVFRLCSTPIEFLLRHLCRCTTAACIAFQEQSTQRRRRSLPVFEARRTLLDEGGHPLFLVLGCE